MVDQQGVVDCSGITMVFGSRAGVRNNEVCSTPESRHVGLTPTVGLSVKYTVVVVVPSRQPCNAVIFLYLAIR